MRKIYLLVPILIIFSFSVFAADYVKLSINNYRCDEDGRLHFGVVNENPVELETNDIVITASHTLIDNQEIIGSWSKYMIYSYEYLDDDSMSDSYFRSNKSQLKYSGDYEITVSYPNCKTAPEPCIEEFSLTDCPGYKYDCDISNITIKSCYSQGGYFYFTYQGLNKGQAEEADPFYDVKYEFKGPNRIWGTDAKPKDFEVKKTGVDIYFGKFPIREGENFTEIYLYAAKCGSQSKVKKKDCEILHECSSNDGCQDNQKCVDKECVSFNCGDCQEPKNHRCVDKCNDNNACTIDSCKDNECVYKKAKDCCLMDKDCDDGLVCTTDTCDDNKCVNEEVKCDKVLDKCVKGVCSEPDGCQYKTLPDCGEKKEENFFVKIWKAILSFFGGGR